MSEFSLVPVDHQPEFESYSLVPVEHDPFAGDDVTPQAQQAQSQQPARGVSQSSAPILGAGRTEAAGSYRSALTAGAGDFISSIPRGIASGLNSSGSALARATQAEMGQDVDAPSPEQGMEILEKEVTGPMHRPEGRAGKFGASVGEFVGNPASYLAPGSLPFKVGTAVLGGLGNEAGGQLGEGTRLEGPLRVAGGVLGALGGLGAARFGMGARAAESAPTIGKTLYHYTDEAGHNGILEGKKLNPSLKALRPRDVKFGNGQYLTDIPPGTMSPRDLSQALVNNSHQGDKFTHYLEINSDGLDVVKGREGVYVIPNEVPLDLNNRIVSSGKVPVE
ncbi:HYD1 signature containing ADP-ribosyltransferase family protein [uncultured Bradyrhizobium sp.]|uniref:HYD1 signature containing ADP-ribosyltransferase family protein n=1 Tax=uncultured Bradyrhizobium sp. TaxID=199684 RepID=UPI0026062CB4|nr:HYD1 signature containing ADP-ribosyltransferase family protein [uncultured Bradyrhizobium sp.]